MSDTDQSKFQLYSLGIAANNKEVDSLELSVTPIEKLQFLDGEIVSLPYDNEVSGSESDDSNFDTKVTTDVALTATWLKGGGNRATPEDIRRGQRVFIYKFADRNEYMWQYAGMDDHLFTTQTIIMRVSATEDESEGVDRTSPDNCYYLEICTRTGKITLQTSKANDEFSTYAIQLDAKRGMFIIADELGNSFSLDSANTILELQNSDGTYLQLDKERILGYANDLIQLEAKNKIGLKAKLVDVDCEKLNVKSNENLFTTPETKFTGNVSVGGTMTATGSATFEGAATFKSPVKFEQPIQANGITSTARIQGPSGSI